MNTSTLKDALEVYESKTTNDYGLYQGKTGLIITYFILSSTLKQESYSIRAKNLIEELSESIGAIKDMTFDNGLAGIGYGIEWIVQNGFIDANTNEVLYDFDDQMYRHTLYSKSNNLSIANGTLSKAMYFHKRTVNKNPGKINYRELCNQECLNLLIQEISDKLNDSQSGLLCKEDLQENEIQEIAQTSIFILMLFKTGINAEVIKNTLCSLLSFSHRYLNQKTARQGSSADLYLIYSCIKTGIVLKDDYALNIGSKGLDNYLITNELNQFNSSFENQLLSSIYKADNRHHLLNNKKDQLLNDPNILSIISYISEEKSFKYNNWDEAWGL